MTYSGEGADVVDILRILDSSGRVHGDPPMSFADVVAAFRLLRLTRLLDTRLMSLSRRDAIGTYPPSEGQEAAAIGSAFALDPRRDWIVPSYREQGALLRHGLPLDNLIANYFGKLDAGRIPDDVKMLTRQQAIGAQLPHAAGLAWGLQARQTDSVVLVYFGDGASSEGDFHEAANLAGVRRAPVIFFLQNNGWAISVPTVKQTAAASFADRAAGYGFPGVLVDGNDLFAVYAATKAAVERARRGDGPTLIEARTYRLNVHNTADNPRRYRSEAEEAGARRAEPLIRVLAYLKSTGHIGEGDLEILDGELNAEIDAAVDRVRRLPRPGSDAVLAHVYDTMPSQFAGRVAGELAPGVVS
jgi:pyruvate dehydrogenase E1 component alpha subunit